MANNYSDVTSRQPELSYADAVHFYLVFDQLPGVVYNAQQIQLPPISIGEADVPNRMNPAGLFIPGDKLNYGTLDVTFLIEKGFHNYRTILKWLKAMTNPEGHEQFTEWVDNQNVQIQQGFKTLFADATLIATDASNEPLTQWNFRDVFPISLDGVQFDSSSQDVEHLLGNCSFRFSYFTNQTYTNGAINNDLI